MTTDKLKIIETIAKLSALTSTDSGAFQGEISNASAKIQELMDKYSISWMEINNHRADKQAKEFSNAFDSQTSDFMHKKIQKWHWSLARLIARVTNTKHYSSSTRMAFFGIDENAQIASALYTLWITNINAMAETALKNHRKEMLKQFGDRPNFFSSLPTDLQPKYYRSSWIDGCLSAMSNNVREQEVAREVAITKERKDSIVGTISKEEANKIILAPTAITLFNRELEIKWKSFSSRFRSVASASSRSGFSNAGYEAGQKAGSAVKIGSKGVGASGQKQLGSG